MAKKKNSDPTKLKTKEENRTLKCQLTDEELLQGGQDLAEFLDSLRSAQEERESITKTYKAKEAEFEAKITSMQLLVRNKYELRPVPCVVTLDYEAGEYYVVRKDTGEEIQRRKMTEDEKQSTLPFNED